MCERASEWVEIDRKPTNDVRIAPLNPTLRYCHLIYLPPPSPWRAPGRHGCGGVGSCGGAAADCCSRWRRLAPPTLLGSMTRGASARIHSFKYSAIHSINHSFIHSFIHSFDGWNYGSIDAFIGWLVGFATDRWSFSVGVRWSQNHHQFNRVIINQSAIESHGRPWERTIVGRLKEGPRIDRSVDRSACLYPSLFLDAASIVSKGRHVH